MDKRFKLEVIADERLGITDQDVFDTVMEALTEKLGAAMSEKDFPTGGYKVGVTNDFSGGPMTKPFFTMKMAVRFFALGSISGLVVSELLRREQKYAGHKAYKKAVENKQNEK